MRTTTTKRKVLFFIPTFPVLTETFIQGEVVKLSQRGNLDVEVLALEGIVSKVHPAIKKNVTIKKVGFIEVFLGFFLILTRFPKFVASFKLLDPLSLSWPKKLYRVIKYFCYTTVFKRIEPDVIVAHFMSEPSTLCMVVSFVTGIPFGVSAHARDVTVDAECVKEKIERALFILVCNKNALEHLIKLNGGKESPKIHLQYHGIDVTELQKIEKSSERTDEPVKRPVIVNIGRLVEKKGHTYLIEASKILKERGIAHLIYIIGPGALYEKLVTQIEESGVSENVKIPGEGGGMPVSETLRLAKSAKVGVFSGIRTDWGDEDGIPNAILEYAALNIPIVSTDAGSSRDFIENEVTGLLVPQKNPIELANKIETLIFNDEISQKVCKGASEKVNGKFDISKNIVNLEKLLL